MDRRGFLIVLAAGTLTSCGEAPRPPERPAIESARKLPPRVGSDPDPTSAASVWKQTLPPDALISPRSEALVERLVAFVRDGISAGRGPWIDDRNCAIPVVRVPDDQPAVRVKLLNGERPLRRSLQAAFDRVPIPPDTKPSSCRDSSLVIEQPGRDRFWELWHARVDSGQWHADYGGASMHASRNRGYYTPDDWPGAKSGWGVSASGLTLPGGLLTLDDARTGQIDHALALSIPESAAGQWAAPAQRTDGTGTSPTAIPYGARLRLDPGLDLDGLRLPAATRMIAEAVQRYGFIVREQTHHNVQIATEAPPRDDPDAYRRLFTRLPGEVMRAFPWNRLQVLDLDMGGPRGR